jgi:hypothetical protein
MWMKIRKDGRIILNNIENKTMCDGKFRNMLFLETVNVVK